MTKKVKDLIKVQRKIDTIYSEIKHQFGEDVDRWLCMSSEYIAHAFNTIEIKEDESGRKD